MDATESIRKLLRNRHNKSGYMLYEEVKRSTGFIKPERFADAIGISLFPSNGISLTGYEIKTSRTDLLSELRDLSKSQAIKQFCDYWILIVSDADILKGKVQPPDDWGIWIWYGEDYLHVKKKPMELYPQPVDRYFLASLLRQQNTAIDIPKEKP